MGADILIDRERLAAANICAETGLATDYLNHFNEVAMLVEIAPDMPEAIEEILAWRPCAYPDHFRRTGFRDKDLAVEAFEAADPFVKETFAKACAKVDAAIADVQGRIAEGIDPAQFAATAAADLYDRIATVGAVILGHAVHVQGEEQDAVERAVRAAARREPRRALDGPHAVSSSPPPRPKPLEPRKPFHRLGGRRSHPGRGEPSPPRRRASGCLRDRLRQDVYLGADPGDPHRLHRP
jgi:translation initiation factor 1 (eIF-1/SUI1)